MASVTLAESIWWPTASATADQERGEFVPALLLDGEGTSSKPVNVLQRCERRQSHVFFQTVSASHDRVWHRVPRSKSLLFTPLEYLSRKITRLLINTARPLDVGCTPGHHT